MLPEELIEKLRYIEIYTRRAVRQHRTGDYRSPLRGRGFEFDQHKKYQHGDDYRQIDWNVTARMQHPYVKREFEEKELSALAVVDLSRSMDFTTASATKREVLMEIAAILTFSAAADNMGVGLLAFTDKIEAYLPPKKGIKQAWRLLEALWLLKPSGYRTRFEPALELISARLKRTSLIFCISDFISVENVLESPYLKTVVHKHDFVPIIVEDQWEEEMPEASGYLRLRDVEQDEELVLTLSPKRRALYSRLARERKAELERALYGLNLDHIFVRTGQPYLRAIMGFLLARKRRR